MKYRILGMMPYSQWLCGLSQLTFTTSCAPVTSHAGGQSNYTPTNSQARAISIYRPGRNLEDTHKMLLCMSDLEQQYQDLKEFFVGQKIFMGREDFVKAGDIPVKWKLKLDQLQSPLNNRNMESIGSFTLAQASRASPYPYLAYYVSSLLSIWSLPGAYRYHAYFDQTGQIGLFSTTHSHKKTTEKSAMYLELPNLCSGRLLAPVLGLSHGQDQVDKQELAVREPTHQTKYPEAVGAEDILAFAVCQQFISSSGAEKEDRQSPLDIKDIVKPMGRLIMTKGSLCSHGTYKYIATLLGIWKQAGTYIQDQQLDILAKTWRDRKSPQDMKDIVESQGRLAPPQASPQCLYLTCYRHIARLLSFMRPPRAYPHYVKGNQLDSSDSARDRRARQRPPDIMGIAEPTCKLALAKGLSACPHTTYEHIASLLGILRQPVMYPQCIKGQQLDRSSKDRSDRQSLHDVEGFLEPTYGHASAMGSSTFAHWTRFRYIASLLGFWNRHHFVKGQHLHISHLEDDRRGRSVGISQWISMDESEGDQRKSDSNRNQHHSASSTGHGGCKCRMVLGSQGDNFQHSNIKQYRQLLFELILPSGITKDVDRGRMSSSTHQPHLKLSSQSQDAHKELPSPSGLCLCKPCRVSARQRHWNLHLLLEHAGTYRWSQWQTVKGKSGEKNNVVGA